MFHDYWANYVTFRVIKRFHLFVWSFRYTENCPESAGHVFKWSGAIFQNLQRYHLNNLSEQKKNIIRRNVLSKFNEEWIKNVVTFRVFMRKIALPLEILSFKGQDSFSNFVQIS
ncbi:hypothetical protein DPMN_108451 [Dreissena polymorpha]|uniref:Uncharacterized protein n=1 Tax=Dreissena polymorpha TaxID=45954 RepID=A0A9D4QKZ9_DREPO|nr:hypothetical protein DPMN_108451 [Dreissena polymorpha]